ncbi:MAG TPA: hypothetical protein VKL21_07200 [Candidatus Methanoperedens sp.]|jgi:hypothetical protein|nr:hypothetical protein [Candidatus Methanoperedens sp.]
MRLVSEIQTTNFLALTSELFSKSKIINLPEKAEYSFQDTLNVLLHAATSTTNTFIAGVVATLLHPGAT